MNDKLVEAFVVESLELLDGLENHLLVLEKDPTEAEALNAAFRALHSIKGSAAMFGYEQVGTFAHQVETLLDLYRGGRIPVDHELADLVLRSGDYLRSQLEGGETDPAVVEALGAELQDLLVRRGGSPAPAPGTGQGREIGEGLGPREERTWRIRYRPSPNSWQRGVRPEGLVREIKAMGQASIHCLVEGVPGLDDYDPEQCLVCWDILLDTRYSEEEIRDVFIFEEGVSEVSVEGVNPEEFRDGDEIRRIGEILAASTGMRAEQINAALNRQRHLGDILVTEFKTPPEQVEEALFKQEHARRVVQTNREDMERKSIRVSSERLDGLLNLVGELVTVQAQLSQAVRRSEDRQVHGISDYIKRLIAELRATSMELRMVPIDALFAKHKRLVRDLAKNLGKDIELVMEGGETEIDKSVIDSLADPMMHLVRNAADHGLESPEERRAQGKPAQGTLTLSAVHAGSFVRILIKDDGRGLDLERIRAKAVDRGLVSEGAVLTKEETEALIFRPGFSTAAQVSSISGRGVGLDVVKTAIERLGGTVSVQSESRKGSTFVLDIPLSMAIIDGFLARSGKQMFIIPLASVHACFERDRSVPHRGMLVQGDELFPYASVRELFAVKDPPAQDLEEVVVVRVFDDLLALGFDQILGGYQTVIKPVGELSRVMPGISGAAILADGGIALILDIGALASRVKAGP